MSPSLSTPDEQGKPKLLGQTRQLMRLRHYSLGTDEAHWIRRFILFHGKRHPRDLAESDIAKFLSNLAVEGRLRSIAITITRTSSILPRPSGRPQLRGPPLRPIL